MRKSYKECNEQFQKNNYICTVIGMEKSENEAILCWQQGAMSFFFLVHAFVDLISNQLNQIARKNHLCDPKIII